MKSLKLFIVASLIPAYFAATTSALAQSAPPIPQSAAPAAVAAAKKFFTPFRITLYGLAAQSLGCMANLQGHINALHNYLSEIDELSEESSKKLDEIIEKVDASGCQQPRIAQAVTHCLAPISSPEATRITEAFVLRLQELSAVEAVFGFCPVIGTGSPIWGRMEALISLAQNLRDLHQDQLVCLRGVLARIDSLTDSCDTPRSPESDNLEEVE